MPVEDPVFSGEYLLKVLYLKTRRNPGHALAKETAILAQNMEVGIEPKKITKGLYGDDSARNCILFNRCPLFCMIY